MNRPLLHLTLTAALLSAMCGGAGCSLWSSTPDTSTAPEQGKSDSQDLAKKKKESALNEIPTTDTKNVSDASQEELFYRGKKYFATEIYSEARQAFQSILSNYPLGPYAEFAEIKSADAVYEGRDFTAAAALYENYYKNHPASESTPYMLFRAARSYHLSQRGVGRDMTNMQKAVKLYADLQQKFPDSAYAAAALQYTNEAHAQMAASEKQVAKFYRKQHKSDAAQAREQAYEQKWLPVLAADAKSVKTGDDNRVAELKRIGGDVGPLPTPAPASPVKGSAAEAAANRDVPIPHAGHVVSAVDCPSGELDQVVLYLDRGITDRDFLNTHATLQPVNGVVSFTLPDTAARAALQQCESGMNVGVSSSGTVTIKTTRAVQLIPIDNPPRIILVLRDSAATSQ